MKRLLLLIALATCAGCVTDSYRDPAGRTFSHMRLATAEKVGAAEVHFPDGTWARLGGLDSQVDPAAVALANAVTSFLSVFAKLALALP